MKKFEEKSKFSAKGIFEILIALNLVWFGLLVFNRLNFADSNEIMGAAEFGLFCLYFFPFLTCIILCGFELRLIDENKHRAMSIETKIDYFLRLGTFALALILAALGVSVRNQIIALLAECVLLSLYELIVICIRNNNLFVIVDWTNRFCIQKYPTTKSRTTTEIKANILLSVYFICLVVLVFFAVGLFEIPIWLIGVILLLNLSNVCLLIFYKVGKLALPVISGICSIAVLGVSYFVSVYYFNLSFIFLFVYSIVQIPFTKMVFKRNNKINIDKL